MTADRGRVEDFLYTEADLLDRWELLEWLELFCHDCQYVIPPAGLDDARPGRDAFLVCDDRSMLERRVASLLKRSAHAEWPHSRTRRMVTNVRVSDERDFILVSANFAVHRFRSGQTATYIGRYEHELVEVSGSYMFRRRKALLDQEVLQPEGKVSIIL